MASQLISYAGWTFLPNLVTGWVQSLYYGITIRAGDPKPQPGTPRYMKHRRRIHFIVITVYLLYTIYEADWEIRRAGDYFQDLGVTPDANDRIIKSKFRRLAALHHPDKAPAHSQGPSENYFVHLKIAQDTLLNPNKRFAYERFGPEVIEWQHCVSIQDYVMSGLQRLLPYYVAGGCFMGLLGVLGYLEWGKYWRFVAFGALMVLEVHTVTRPYFPPLVTKVFNPMFNKFTGHPPYLPFQLLLLARKIVLTLFLAFSQLGPLLEQQKADSQQSTEADQDQQLHHLEHVGKATDYEAARLLGLDMAPFATSEKSMNEVRTKLQGWLVQNTIRGDPEVRSAVGAVMTRRRANAPAGAKGTK